jgi:hypothetical protein
MVELTELGKLLVIHVHNRSGADNQRRLLDCLDHLWHAPRFCQWTASQRKGGYQ